MFATGSKPVRRSSSFALSDLPPSAARHVVEEERAAGLEVLVHAAEGLPAILVGEEMGDGPVRHDGERELATEAHRAHVGLHGAVPSAERGQLLGGALQHCRAHVDADDIVARVQQPLGEPAGARADLEQRLAGAEARARGAKVELLVVEERREEHVVDGGVLHVLVAGGVPAHGPVDITGRHGHRTHPTFIT